MDLLVPSSGGPMNFLPIIQSDCRIKRKYERNMSPKLAIKTQEQRQTFSKTRGLKLTFTKHKKETQNNERKEIAFEFDLTHYSKW